MTIDDSVVMPTTMCERNLTTNNLQPSAIMNLMPVLIALLPIIGKFLQIWVDNKRAIVDKTRNRKPLRPILGGTLNGVRPMKYDYWRTGYGAPIAKGPVGENEPSIPFWVELAGEYHCKPNYETGEFDHNEGELQIYYQVGGKGILEFNKKRVPTHPGDVFIIPRGKRYRHSSKSGVQYHWVALEGVWPKYFYDRVGYHAMKPNNEIENLFVELRENLIMHQSGYEVQAVGLVFNLMARIVAAVEPPNVNGSSRPVESSYPTAVRDAVYLLRETYAEPVMIDKVAAAVGISPAHLRTLFKKWVGESPQQFHTRHRIEQAQKLMRQQSLAIYEVAYHVGFTDARYFARVFKQITGMTPSQYMTKKEPSY